MNTKLILKSALLTIITCSLIILHSCSKSKNDAAIKEQNDNKEEVLINETDFTESDKDLMSVDYKEIYDILSPHGDWIQVTPDEIGLKSETVFYEGSGSRGLSMSDLIGVKDANAITNTDEVMVYVWKPSIEFGATFTAGEAKAYFPYTNGQWINSDAGWYFKAPTAAEETVSHYGRWVNTPEAGWLWVPGRVWSPAWVDWKQNDNYISWAPLPPSVYIDNGTITVPEIADYNYIIVERKYFLEPNVIKHSNIYYPNEIRVPVSSLKRTEGVVVVNNTIINRGPDINIFQTILGRNIEVVNIQRAGNYREVRYSEREYIVYKPVFRKFKNKGNKKVYVNVPASYKRYNEWKVKTYQEKESGQIESQKNKNNDKRKSYDNENKSTRGNNWNKNNENGKEYKSNGSDVKGNKNNGNDNNNGNNGNNSGNGKENKKGNDNGKGKK